MAKRTHKPGDIRLRGITPTSLTLCFTLLLAVSGSVATHAPTPSAQSVKMVQPAPKSTLAAIIPPVITKETRRPMVLASGEDKRYLSAVGRGINPTASFQAKWRMGLAAWKDENKEVAAEIFSNLAADPKADKFSPWERSAAHFWAWRSWQAVGNQTTAQMHLAAAATYTHTFYGTLATKALNSRIFKGKALPADRAFYPVPEWKPVGGYKVEAALIHAFARQESRFNPHAISPAGAMGVMQLMPATARAMMRKSGREGMGSESLLHPETNIMLGQTYIQYLRSLPAVQDNLIYLMASYNAGPGNLIAWKKSVGTDDPLLFMESIPVTETRHYVQQVLTNYWMYQALSHTTPTTAIALSKGEWPVYGAGS